MVGAEVFDKWSLWYPGKNLEYLKQGLGFAMCSEHRKVICQRWATLPRPWRVELQASQKILGLSNLLGDSDRALVVIYET